MAHRCSSVGGRAFRGSCLPPGRGCQGPGGWSKGLVPRNIMSSAHQWARGLMPPVIVLKCLFIFILERTKERRKHQLVVLLTDALAGGFARVPDQGSNLPPRHVRTTLQPTEPPGQGPAAPVLQLLSGAHIAPACRASHHLSGWKVKR